MHSYARLQSSLLLLFRYLAALCLAAMPAATSGQGTVDLELNRVPISSLVDDYNLPSYEDLRFTGGVERDLSDAYLPTLLRVATSDVVTSGIVFPWVPRTSPYAELEIGRLVDLALANNLDLINTDRSVRIARSQVRSAESEFTPFVDIVTDSRYSFARDANATRVSETVVTEPPPGSDGPPQVTQVITSTNRDTDIVSNRGGIESGVTLPTGGRVTLDASQTRTDRFVTDGGGELEKSKQYDTRAGVRYIQPLLRGAGPEVAQAELRRSRLREMDQLLAEKLQERDLVFDVITAYFQLLQVARQLQVSSDAIRIRTRFLEETQIKFDVGRVDESEILRAEIQFLSEQETAIGRLRRLDDARDRLLILLGLPLDTPISFVDVTERLANIGRVDIPDIRDAVLEGLSNRMELMRQDIQISIGEIDTRVARNAVLPQLDFDAGYNRSDTAERAAKSYGWENQGWDAGISFRLPLVNIDRREASRRAVLTLDQRRTQRLITERNLASDVLTNHRQLLATEAQLTLLRKNVEQARKSLELINGKFEVGFATVTEVRLAQDDLFNAETRYSDAILNYQIQIARLYVALGRPLL